MIRFDINNSAATINYLVDKSQRGKGIGSAIVENGLKKFFFETKFYGSIYARVKTSNPASLKIFERLKFEKESEDSKLVHFKKSF
jgi:RimJ/RimL family protein N-acetyltransferase